MTNRLLFLLLLATAGCARVNRYSGDFIGRLSVAEFEDGQGMRETGIVLAVEHSERLRVIGKDNLYLPTSGFSAVLIKRHDHLIAPNELGTNKLLKVNGILDLKQPISKQGRSLSLVGGKLEDFRPSIRVRRIVATMAK